MVARENRDYHIIRSMVQIPPPSTVSLPTSQKSIIPAAWTTFCSGTSNALAFLSRRQIDPSIFGGIITPCGGSLHLTTSNIGLALLMFGMLEQNKCETRDPSGGPQISRRMERKGTVNTKRGTSDRNCTAVF